MNICGVDKIVHGSDYPFASFDDGVRRIDSFDRTLRKVILEDNAQRLFEI